MRAHSLFRNLFIVVAAFLLLNACGSSDEKPGLTDSAVAASPYLNHGDSAQYVGMQTCRRCHENIYQTFIETGMGKSFDHATRLKSAGDFSKSILYDKFSDLKYQAFFKDSTLFMHEYRLDGKDTLHSFLQQIDYIVGSGQHTNSHIFSENGYLYQAPMTYYAQKGVWDLPPGFENGYNSRFSRKIGLECMSCHNSLPQFVMGSENKFTEVPNGIGCERCHGPGSIHVREKMAGNIVDTSRYIDYTIVNPGKLSPDLQFDVCQRCHLQGNAVLKPGKSFYDFRPGMLLSDVMTVFMPKYEGGEDEFIMASHAERMKMSRCFIETEKNTPPQKDNLRPSRNAMTCVTCHNPHVSVKKTNGEHFNNACKNCHQPGKNKLVQCSEKPENIEKAGNNCVSCHMPRSGSIDIPHVTVHDHFIRKPAADKKTEVQAVREFLGLYAVNEKQTSNIIKARAYLQQYEKFEKNSFYLDSAARLIPASSLKDRKTHFQDLVHLNFLKNDFNAIVSLVNAVNAQTALDSILVVKSFDNRDAWCAYRIGEAFLNTGNPDQATSFYAKSVELASFHPDFRAKYALSLALKGNNAEARAQYQMVLNQHPRHVSALNSLGYLWLQEGNDVKAEAYYRKALQADPDDEQALLNMAGLYLYRNDMQQAEIYLNRLLKKNPNNVRALQIKQQMKALNKKK